MTFYVIATDLPYILSHRFNRGWDQTRIPIRERRVLGLAPDVTPESATRKAVTPASFMRSMSVS